MAASLSLVPLASSGAVRSRAVSYRQDLARADARVLRRLTGVPPGCRHVPGLTTAAAAALSKPFGYPASPYEVDVAKICLVSMPEASVDSWLSAHVPAGATLNSTGQSNNGEEEVTFNFRPWLALPVRESEVSLYPLGANSTAVRVDGIVLYSPARPASERIPGGVTEVVVSVTPEHGPAVVRDISAPGVIERLRQLVNSCQRSDITSNPGGIDITATTAREEVELRFFGGGPGGRRLLAVVIDHPLLGEGTGNTQVWVHGVRQPILQDNGSIGGEAGKLTGVKVVVVS